MTEQTDDGIFFMEATPRIRLGFQKYMIEHNVKKENFLIGWYESGTDQIGICLENLASNHKGDSEDGMISAVIQIITHEYLHKTVNFLGESFDGEEGAIKGMQ